MPAANPHPILRLRLIFQLGWRTMSVIAQSTTIKDAT